MVVLLHFKGLGVPGTTQNETTMPSQDRALQKAPKNAEITHFVPKGTENDPKTGA